MGRRSNVVISEFFLRGQKLDDSSNRYQHTCKKCGEHFAKGRSDSMLNHLLKRCPNMTQEDRNLAFLHMQNSSNGPGKAKKQAAVDRADEQNVEYAQSQLPLGTHQMLDQQRFPIAPVIDHMHHMQQQVQHGTRQGPPPIIPHHMLMQRKQSALDTLAEVSRRHMDYSGQTSGYMSDFQEAATLSHSDPVLVEQVLVAALQRQNAGDQNAPSIIPTNSLPMYANFEPQAQVGAEQAVFANTQITMPLPQNTIPDNHQIEQNHYESSNPNDAPLDPQLDEQMDCIGQSPPAPDYDPPQQPQPQADDTIWTQTPQDFVTQQDPPSNDPNPEFGLLYKTDKANARARFTDTRRKEVREIRKRGACLRCRMLKKSCSPGTPCGACEKVDSARLWKGTCVRTKLAEEFTLYSTSYFRSQMAACFANDILGMNHGPIPGRLEVALVPHYTLVMTFSTKRYLDLDNGQQHDQGLSSQDVPFTDKRHDTIVLDDDMASQKISSYCTKDAVIDARIESEKSSFMQATLREAKALLEAERSQQTTTTHKSTTRVNNISPSVLLLNVIELWMETNLLVSEPRKSLHIRYNSNSLSCQDPQVVIWPEDAAQPSFTPGLDSQSLDLVHSQIFAATETACHRLCRAVMNELERRLLQRQQVSAFATFISAVILFNCIERITAFYHSLDSSSSSSSSLPATAPEAYRAPLHADSNFRPPRRSLSASASSAQWLQGPRFAHLLTMLLRMRALPPRTARTADNELIVLQEPSLPVRLNGVAVREPQDAETEKAASWLDPLGLDVDELRAKRDGEVSETGCEMKFVAGVLLGESL